MLRNKKNPDMFSLNAIDAIAVNTNMKKKKTTDKKPKLKLKPDGTQLVNGKFRSFLKMSRKSTRFKTCLRY